LRSAIVFVVVTVLSGFGYEQVARALLAATGQRVANASQQVSGMLHESALGLRSAAQSVASDSAVARFLGHDGSAPAELAQFLGGDLARTTQVAQRTLWSRDGRLRYALPAEAPPLADFPHAPLGAHSAPNA